MIVLLNSIPWIISLIIAFWGYNRVKNSNSLNSIAVPVICLLLFWSVYTKVQPSYLPKGEIKRTSIPTFEHKEFEVKDLQPKPMKGEDRDSRRKKLYEEKLPFIENSVDTK